MYARWVPPTASSGARASSSATLTPAPETSASRRTFGEYEEQGKADMVEEGTETEQAIPSLAASNGFGYARWTPGAPASSGVTTLKSKPLLKRRKVDTSSEEEPSSGEDSSSSDESSEDEKKSESNSDSDSDGDGGDSDSSDGDSDTSDSKAHNNDNPKIEPGVDSCSENIEMDVDEEAKPDNPIILDADTMDLDNEVGELIAKRPKKEKKKAKQQITSDSEAKDAMSKHKAVMERKAKSLHLAQTQATAPKSGSSLDSESDNEKHGLEPLPQPEVPLSDEVGPANGTSTTFETLPAWLAAPIRVSATTRTSFSELGFSAAATARLVSKGYTDAFAVQTATIPLLTPSARPGGHDGDVLVAAATGSGKTLAYALPLVRDISAGVVTRLRALVVLPTRELVRQAAEAFEVCAGAFDGANSGGKRVRVGVSVGNQSLKYEQSVLLERRERVAGLEDMETTSLDNGDDDGLRDEEEEEKRAAECAADYLWRVDVLICTPGRLVDHLRHTPGFDLAYLRWLVVDEADKLLAQSFQDWLGLLTERLAASAGVFSARDHPGCGISGVRKVVLSATLTRDLSLLAGLGLRHPRLVVLEGGKGGDGEALQHVLPEGLEERVVRLKDGAMKPLYLVEVLKRLAGERMKDEKKEGKERKNNATNSASSSSESESESGSSSDLDSDSSSSSSSCSSSDSDSNVSKTPKQRGSAKAFCSTVLIFTKSNESALRLTRLLTLLSPSLAPIISTLTSSTVSSARRHILRSFSSRTIRILIASDLVARGVDVPRLDHVVNYDLPASLAGYVHRVGRTARAGRAGVAWTLLPDNESGWFWGRIAKAKDVGRSRKVDRVRVGGEDGELPEADIARYEEALQELGRMARGQQG
ncbi:ATP-dependent RNA helicase dbp6 [Ceratocystis pirilliformis]|uniref:ATP-dependent RNA helicase n=1 Tax=Ceratocystis pirilliformis TaxID=259994 RepID=A0ABR3YWI1_9PEZI